jgi:hypothetical protein
MGRCPRHWKSWKTVKFSCGNGEQILPIISRHVEAVWDIMRELVSKTLHRFADEGMIEISRVQFIFTNRGESEQLAGHDE